MADKLAVIQAEASIAELIKIEEQIKKLISVERNLIKTTNDINKALKTGTPKEYTKAIKEMNAATKEFNKSQMQLANQLTRVTKLERQVAQLLRDQSRAIRDVASATREESRAREAAERVNTQQQRTAREAANAQAAQNRASRDAANAANAESRARQQATREANANSRANQLNSSAHAQLTRQVREARQRARDYGAEIVNLNNRMRSGEITRNQFRQQMSGLERNFRTSTNEAIRLERQLRNLNQATLPAGQRNGALWGRVTDIVKGVSIVNILQNTASSFYNMGVKAVETARKLDSLRLAQMSVFKTNEEVNRQNVFLTGVAEKYGIEITGLTDAYTKFAASAQGTYLEGQRTQDIFDSVTRSSSLLGVSTDDTTGILKALGQMMSKGKVQAEELRGQLGDRMAGAFKLFADGMGISTSELDAMLKKGEVLADDVLPKFAEQLNRKYELGVGEEVNTMNANINRLSNSWTGFVEGVESGSGVISKAVIGVTNALSNMLKALTPNMKVTIIEKEQAQLLSLGRTLKDNFTDESKRKSILDEMLKINPFFLGGLDKEKATLEEIGIQLQKVNQQYIQKITLEKQQEIIKELIDDQAQSYVYLSRVFTDNAVEFSNFNQKTQDAINNYSTGAISYDKAMDIIGKSTKSMTKEQFNAESMMYRLKTVIEQSSLNFDGYNRGINGNVAAIKEASKQYNYLVDFTNKLIGANGQLVHSNGLLATSFNNLGQAQINQKKEADEIIRAAEKQGQKFALVRNVWRQQNDRGGWFTTDKKGDNWYLENGKLLERKKTEILQNEVKEEKYKTSRLDGIQKDYLKDLQANRDLELALNETKFVNAEQTEKQYLQNVLKINTDFFNKKIAYLKGKNAEERKQRADAILDQAKLEKETQKKIFDIDAGQLEEQNKIKINEFERSSKQIENNQYITNVERLNQQIDNGSKMIQQLSSYYDSVIDLAEKANQDTLEIERKRDDEIGKIQDERNERLNDLPEAFNNDIDRISTLSENLQNKDYEDQRLEILKMRIPLRNREFLLNQLDLESNRVSLLNQRNALEIKKNDLDKISEANKLTKDQEVQYSDILSEISHINSELDVTAKNLEQLKLDHLLEDLQPLKDLLGNGLSDLGLENVSNQFDDLFDKIVAGTFSARDAVVLASSAIADGLTSMVNRNKENTIAALDEQLKYTQETTEQEIEFINGRLNQLNALETLTEEQMQERNRLEDEARTYKEQQMQREKMIEAQKARAEQKAAAQQALINGALAATMTLAQMGFIAGIIPAGLALGFGLAQSIAISSKDPVPKYRMGRNGGKAEYAITQDGGRELITNKKGEIKSLGSDKGDQLTWLDEGDTVHTASQTKGIIKRLGALPNLGENLYQKLAQKSLTAPTIVYNPPPDNSDAIADKVGKRFENALKKYDKPAILKRNGHIILYRGANLGEIIGEYDPETGNETYYS